MSRFLFLFAFAIFSAGCTAPGDALSGRWRAVVELPGGELPFHIEFVRGETGLEAYVINGSERARVDEVSLQGDRLQLAFPAFNNQIAARVGDGRMEGTLTLVKRGGKKQEMAFAAERGPTHRFFAETGPGTDFGGRWAMEFFGEDGQASPAVGEFTQVGTRVEGTIMTPTGDYRYLAGQALGETLFLSTFDGAHAFLFSARPGPDGGIVGDFWSGTAWHERWQARRDSQARLPDAASLTFLKPGYERLAFTFPDTQGRPVSLHDPQFAGKVVLVALAGSWCPNCHDEAAFLTELHEKYGAQGLEVVSLMYEHFGDFETAAGQVERMREKFGAQYTMLVAGISDKTEAAATLPMLNRVLAFPTTLFIDREGEVRFIHTGFTGPGTGVHYDELVKTFTGQVESLLDEDA